MTLRMGDGPVANLPGGLDAYAGYTDQGGIGVTFPGIVQRFPNALHLSISVHGLAPAMCGDVENGALSSWAGYDYGYTAISNAQAMINRYGRPKKLWTAHYDSSLGAHICSKNNPACAKFGFQDEADGTQWTNHGGPWDESLLADDFFVLDPPPPSPIPQEEENMWIFACTNEPTIVVVGGLAVTLPDAYDIQQLVNQGAKIVNVDAAFMERLKTRAA